jgi:gas vesicle protein GvpL/GvpF
MSTYVYGFTSSAHPLGIDGITGVGADKPPLRVVRHDGLAAVVSDAPEGLRPKRRDLEAHQAILDTLGSGGTVLPMRFGTVAPDDDAVAAELAARAEHYGALLTELTGKTELNVKVVHREDDVLRALLLSNPGLQARNEALRAAGGGTHQDRVAFGEAMAAALEGWCAVQEERIVAELRPHAAQLSFGPLAEGCFVNASFLVADTARSDFDTALARVREALAAVADVNLYGPLPPYSFVASDEASDAMRVGAGDGRSDV